MIHLFALSQRWSDDETVPVAVLFELLWGHHENIHGLSDAIEAHVNFANDLAWVVVSAPSRSDILTELGFSPPQAAPFDLSTVRQSA